MRASALAVILIAGCASAPKEPLRVRHAAPGEAVMADLECVSVAIGFPCRVVVRNERDEDRAIVWFALWRTQDGYAVKEEPKVRELIVAAHKEGEIVAVPPSEEAKQFELWVGDRR